MPDLLILDLAAPGMDGYEVCRRLQDDPDTAGIAVLMLSTKGGVEEPTEEAWRFARKVQDRLKGFDAGAIEFVTKPVMAKELIQRAKAVLWALGLTE